MAAFQLHRALPLAECVQGQGVGVLFLGVRGWRVWLALSSSWGEARTPSPPGRCRLAARSAGLISETVAGASPGLLPRDGFGPVLSGVAAPPCA